MSWNEYASVTVLSTAKNYILSGDAPFVRTYRTYIKPKQYGELRLKFWTNNRVDSTWDDGSVSRADLPGGRWTIEAAYVGIGGPELDGSVLAGSEKAVTYDSSSTRKVEPGEAFWSDPVELNIPEGRLLVFTWTLTVPEGGKSIPYNTEGVLVSSYEADGPTAGVASAEPFRPSSNALVLPDLIAYECGENVRRLAFFGDSITQGVRTRRDAYEYWVARIGESLASECAVWNLGSGWARAYDAAVDGAWLGKVKRNDEAVIALGVNDIGTGGRSGVQVLESLHTLINRLKRDRPSLRVTLCTVPPFNFQNEQEAAWRQVNDTIRSRSLPGVDLVFDLARVLSREAPFEHMLRPEYMSDEFDAHPNGLAGEAVAAAFLDWYRNNGKGEAQ